MAVALYETAAPRRAVNLRLEGDLAAMARSGGLAIVRGEPVGLPLR